MKAVSLLSGGLDSCVVATYAVKEWGRENVLALSFDYAQRHKKELLHARQVAAYLKIAHKILTIPPVLWEQSDSTLLDPSSTVPTGPYSDQPAGTMNTYVPFRNATFISFATAIALQCGAEFVLAGMHSDDAANWAYPDCTPEFSGAMACAIWTGTGHKVRLITPLQWLTKPGVVNLGFGLGAPLHLTWSCYNGLERPCGTCPTCIDRAGAFKAAGIDDPAL